MVRQSRTFHWPGTWVTAAARPGEGAGRVVRLVLAILVVVASALAIGLATGLLTPTSPMPTIVVSAPPVAQVLDYALGRRSPAEDPPVMLSSGSRVKSSNYSGVHIGDTTYYYNLAPRPSYDPLARGEVTAQQIHVVAIVGDPPDRVMVYTVARK
jgi:hypothetical protein